MDDISLRMEEDLIAFAESIPVKGTHISYLADAYEIFKLYGKFLSIEEKSPANEETLKEIAEKIGKYVR